MEVKYFDDGILFNNNVFFSQTGKLLKNKINLLPIKGVDIKKKQSDYFLVDYPGEYEKYNIYINVLANDNRLNFFIYDYTLNKSYAFIQDPSVLDKLELVDYPNIWYCKNDLIANHIEKLGFEGEIIKIEDNE